MPNVVGVRFRRAGKVYYFDPAGYELNVDDRVVVDTTRGPEIGQVVLASRQVAESELEEPLKPVVRPATICDLRSMQAYRLQECGALEKAREEVSNHNLPMKVVGAEYSFDGTRLTFYFTAEGRVDFRDLVRDLARMFKLRIELRQVGPRDETKLMDGIGICGRRLCCASFLDNFSTVSIRMAKLQGLPLNPLKISGPCGRLLCCLGYEEEFYREAKARMPKVGDEVETIYGLGRVQEVNVITERLLVEYPSGTVKDITLNQLGAPPPEPPRTREPEPLEGPAPAEGPEPAEKAEQLEAELKRRRRRRHQPRAGGGAPAQSGAREGQPAARPAAPKPSVPPVQPRQGEAAEASRPEGKPKPRQPGSRGRPRRRPGKKSS